MAYVKFNNAQNAVKATVTPQGVNMVTLKFPDTVVVNTSGFRLFLDKEMEHDIGGDTYRDFTTMYRNDEETAKYNGYQLSNDGSVYEPPVTVITFTAGGGGKVEGTTSQTVSDYSQLIIPKPVADENYVFVRWNPAIPTEGAVEKSKTFTAVFSYVETLEEVKERKVTEMNEAQQTTIQNGVDVTLTDGSIEHFTLKDQDQTSLMGLQTQVAAGTEKIPWHTSDQSEPCKYYSNADMQLIVTAAMGFVTFEVTYFRDLRIYINSMATKEEVEAVTYGMYIPEEYQSEVLKDLYAAMGGNA